MSESSNLLEAQVKQVMSQRGTGKGTRGIHVQCFVCSKMVRKLRLHIRKSHKNRCLVSCSACPAKFVGQNDLSNHRRNGCPHGLPSPPKANLRNKRPTISVELKSKEKIGEHKAICDKKIIQILITALLKFNCFLSATVTTQCTYISKQSLMIH